MIFTFYKALGKSVGVLPRRGRQDRPRQGAHGQGGEKGVKILLPTDVVVADKFAADAKTQTCPSTTSPRAGWASTSARSPLKSFQAELNECKSVIWNGPMGVFEMEAFAKGTFAYRRHPREPRRASRSSVAATPSPPSRRLASRTRCRTSPPAAAPPSSSSRARCSPASPRSTRRKRLSMKRRSVHLERGRRFFRRRRRTARDVERRPTRRLLVGVCGGL